MPENLKEVSNSQKSTLSRTEVFKRDGTKRRTTVAMSDQATEDIAELMRRGRSAIPGDVIATSVHLLRLMPPEFVSMLNSRLDTGGPEAVDAMCRDFIRHHI